MLDALASGAADALIAYDLDRAARDPRDLEDLIDTIESSRPRIPVESATGSLRLANDADITMARVMVAVANKSSRDTARRVAAARERQARAGKYAGGMRPFGYTSKGDELIESEAVEIRAAAEALLAGVSMRQIVASLRDRGVPTVTGAPWSMIALRAILGRARNAGLAVYKGEVTGRAQWPAILDEDTWRLVRAKLDDPSRRTSRGNTPRWLGSLIYRCGTCGGMVTVSGTASGNHRQPGYVCKNGGHVRRAALSVDEYVAAVLVARLARPDAAAILNGTASLDTSALAREANIARDRLNQLAVLYANGDIDAAQLATASADLRQRITAADRALAAAAPGNGAIASIAGRADAAEVWAGLDLGYRRAILRTLATVTLLPGARGRMPDGSYFDPDSVRIEWMTA
jgi:hypothetical protein